MSVRDDENKALPGLVPRPDPSTLTTEAISREVITAASNLRLLKEQVDSDLKMRQEIRQREAAAQKELFATQVESIKHEFQSKIESINTATALRIKAVDEMPHIIEKEIDHHENLQIERFRSIKMQFEERDIRTAQAQVASADALAAALQAAKELVGAQGEASAAAAVKSETSFTKQIDQIGTIIQTLEKALDARITELKERIDRGEGNANGQIMQRTESRASMAVMYGVGGLILGIVMATIAVFAKV